MTLFDRSFPLERVEHHQKPVGLSDASRLRVGLGIAYDGTDFHGFAPQPGRRSVAGVLLDALQRLLGDVEGCVCAGRTDAGVHALGQVIHFDCDESLLTRRFGEGPLVAGMELVGLERSLSALLAPEITCWRALVMPEGFDARRSALARRYRYDVDATAHPDPLRRRVAWQHPGPLDLAAMRLATDAVLGEHDFSAFCRRPDDQGEGPLLRRVLRADWHVPWTCTFRFEIEAQAFCHHMVRSIVGALVAVGEGRLVSSDVLSILRSAERANAPAMAPPEGLCLIDVTYPEVFGALLGPTAMPESAGSRSTSS